MHKHDIANRGDVDLLVRIFYNKILEDDDLSEFFLDAVHNWAYHHERFVDYWESVILEIEIGDKSPLSGDVHIKVDRRFGNTFKQKHFKRWLSLFQQTVDELFEGPKAEWAKVSARQMADNIHKKMFFGRRMG